MMNKNGYIPLSLMEVSKKIRHEHQGSKKSTSIHNDEKHVQELIIKIVSMNLGAIQRYLKLIENKELERELYIFSEYLPNNYLGVDVSNIVYILKQNISDSIFKILFKQWCDHYDAPDIGITNDLLLNCMHDDRCAMAVDELHIRGTFEGWIESSNIEKMVCMSLLDKSKRNNISSVDVARYLGIYQRKIYENAMKHYYLYCYEDDYYRLSDKELYDIVKNYKMKDTSMFVHNFMTKMSFASMKNAISVDQNFGDQIWRHINAVVGEPETKKFNSFFADSDSMEKSAYMRWYSLRQADYVFGDDERGKYWKSKLFVFDDVSFKYHLSCNGLVMKIGDFTFIEFRGRQSGPLYAFSNKYFTEKVKKYFDSKYNNTDMRQTLLHNHTLKENFINRIEHRGNWMKDTDKLINSLVKTG